MTLFQFQVVVLVPVGWISVPSSPASVPGGPFQSGVTLFQFRAALFQTRSVLFQSRVAEFQSRVAPFQSRVAEFQSQATLFQSRAALSLLGYCHFYQQEFDQAAEYYGRLVQLFPENEDYRLYFSQALYQACRYEEAMKETSQIDGSEYAGKVGTADTGQVPGPGPGGTQLRAGHRVL